MNIDLLERAAEALGDLLPEVTFVGGATVGLWLSDEAAPFARPTKDVDVVVELAGRPELHEFERRLRERGFREDKVSGVICRWNHGPHSDILIVDVMPTDPGLLGFSNVWQARAVPKAVGIALPSGRMIQAIPPPYLMATKVEAFRGRGGGDYGRSHDLEDVVTLVDGREELLEECRESSPELRGYLGREVASLLGDPAFLDTLAWHLRPDIASQDRLDVIVLPRLKEIVLMA